MALDMSLLLARSERDSTAAAYDSLSTDALASIHGVAFLGDGLQTRGVVLQRLMADPAYGTAELAIRAFLLFLFLALVILKLFQPRGVRIYFNEQLQDLYSQYRRGAFDKYLRSMERSTGSSPFKPLRFEDWCLNTYQAIREQDFRARERSAAIAAHTGTIDQLTDVSRSAESELAALSVRHDDLTRRLIETERQRGLSAADVAVDERQQAEEEQGLARLKREIESGTVGGRNLAEALAMRSKMQDAIARRAARISAQRAAAEAERRRLDALLQESDTVSAQITDRERVVADISQRLAAERLAFASESSRGGSPRSTREAAPGDNLPNGTERERQPRLERDPRTL